MDDLVRQLQEELAHVRRERDGWMAQIGKVAALVPIPDVVKYTGTTGDLIRWLTSRVAAADEAAAAIAEAQATIARLEARLADVTGAAARLDDTRIDQMRRLCDFAVAFAAEVADTYPAAAKSFCEGLAALSPGKGE